MSMKAWRRFWFRLLGSLTRRDDDSRLREELESHLALQAADNERAGLAAADASRQARAKLGAIEAIRAEYRAEQRLPLFDDLLQDARHTLRVLRNAPLFTATAIASLAMGIGANTAVFTVIERVLLRPLPVSKPHELVYVADERIATQSSPRFSYPFYRTLRDSSVLDAVAARWSLGLNAAIDGAVLRVSGELVSGNYFDVLGVRTPMGRLMSVSDDRTPGAHPVAVISDAFWRRVLASAPTVVGRELTLNAQPFRIVGVAPAGFAGTDLGSPPDIWIPLMMQREVGRDLIDDARTNWLEIIGRLRPGMTRERAADELTRDLDRRANALPAPLTPRRILLVAGERGNSPVRAELGPALGSLMALAGVALALACINIASLVSVRAAGREKEVAVRLALGAGRSRLVRQLLTEGLVLAGLGGAAGVAIAPMAARLLIASQPRTLGIDVSVDPRAFVFALAASVLAGLSIAQAPILASRRVTIADAFKASGSLKAAGRRLHLHDAIVALQIAVALAMLTCAALFVQSLRSFGSVDPGFRADNLMLVSVDPAAAGYSGDRIDGFWREMLARVSSLAGVEEVTLARTVPLEPVRRRQPWRHPASGEQSELDTNVVGPAYFRTLDIPVLSGREFDEHDTPSSRPVVIINAHLARLFWPGQDAVGKGLRLPDAGNPTAEVIGVVRDVKYRNLRSEAGPMIYRSLFQTRSSDSLSLHVRASVDPMSLVGPIRSEIQRLDRNVPVFTPTTLEQQMDGTFAQTRQAAVLTGVFGVIAMVLSGIGVYGVTALAVRRRTRDIGIRIALGAERRDVIRAIGRRGAGVVAAGLMLGTAGSFGLTALGGSLLFGVTAADGGTVAGVAVLLALVSVIAFAVPARQATRLDAVAAIRHE
jgi:predicted permease